MNRASRVNDADDDEERRDEIEIRRDEKPSPRVREVITLRKRRKIDQ